MGINGMTLWELCNAELCTEISQYLSICAREPAKKINDEQSFSIDVPNEDEGAFVKIV